MTKQVISSKIAVIALVMIIVLCSLAYWSNQASSDDLPPPHRPKEDAIIPKPMKDPIKGPRDMRDMMLMLHVLSRHVLETEEEHKLEFADFDPEATIKEVLQPKLLPEKIRPLFRKKKKWWPYFLRLKFHEHGGLDAAVARFSTEGYTVQIAESRAAAIVIVRSEAKGLDLTATEIAGGLPKCFIRVFNEDIFKGVKRKYHMEAKFPDALTVRAWGLSPLIVSRGTVGAQFRAQVVWTDKVMVLRLSKSYRQVANPVFVIRRPLFIRSDLPQPYQKQIKELERLSAQGVRSISKVVALIKKTLSEIPRDPAARQKEAIQDSVRYRNRRLLLRKGYSLLVEQVKLATKEDKALRHQCWSSAASVIPNQKFLRQEAKALAHTLLEEMGTSGKSDDIAMMKEFLLKPEFARVAKDGLEILAKQLGAEEIQKWLMPRLQSIAENPDKDAKMTVRLLRVTPGHFDDRVLKAVGRILRGTKNRNVQMACLHFLAGSADGIATFRKATITVLRLAAASKNSHVKSWSIIGFRKCRDLSALRTLRALLSAKDARIRREAAVSICDILHWPLPPPDKKGSVEKIKEHINRLLAVVESDDGKWKSVSVDVPKEWFGKAPQSPEATTKTAQPFSLSKLIEVAKSPDSNPPLTVALLQSAPTDYKPSVPDILGKIFTKTNKTRVQSACVQVAKRCADSVESFQDMVWTRCNSFMRSDAAGTRRLAAQVLAISGNFRVVKPLVTLLSDKDRQVRIAAARAICFMLEWPSPKAGASEKEVNEWITWVKQKTQKVVAAAQWPTNG